MKRLRVCVLLAAGLLAPMAFSDNGRPFRDLAIVLCA
jgi:hypothetical protein